MRSSERRKMKSIPFSPLTNQCILKREMSMFFFAFWMSRLFSKTSKFHTSKTWKIPRSENFQNDFLNASCTYNNYIPIPFVRERESEIFGTIQTWFKSFSKNGALNFHSYKITNEWMTENTRRRRYSFCYFFQFTFNFVLKSYFWVMLICSVLSAYV